MGTKHFHSLTVSAPGKVILHGEHSVVYGKTAVAASLGLRSTITLKERNGNEKKCTAKLNFPLVSLEKELDLILMKEFLFNVPALNGKDMTLDSAASIDHIEFLKRIDIFLKHNDDGFDSMRANQKNALRTFVYISSAFIGISNIDVQSLDVFADSELTVGAGTGSSASYSVCLVGAVLQYVLLKIDKSVLEGSKTCLKLFSPEHQLIISSWAFNAERIMHGNPSGVDNSVCAFGSYIKFQKGLEPVLLNIPLNLRILLVDTTVPRETKILVSNVASLRSRNIVAVDNILDACDSISTRAVEIMTAMSKNHSDENLLKEGFRHLEELWGMNHCLLSAIGVSHPKLDLIRSLASEHGLACKLTGAGGGGYAIILVPPYTEESTVKHLCKALESSNFVVKETKLAGNGVRLDNCVFR